jgi:hypothetical protein
MALLLSRPLIINQSSFAFELPNTQLEGGDSEEPPSPIAHITAQLALGEIITKVPGAIGGTIDTTHGDNIRTEIQNWLACLPPAYRNPDPDTQWDLEYPYVVLHRAQLNVVGYMTMFLPFKASLVKCFDSSTAPEEHEHRRTAVDIALELMSVSRQLFDIVFPTNAKFHLITFILLDTAAFLCSAVIHDKSRSLPRGEEVLRAIGLACSLMKQLAELTKTGAACFSVLKKLARSIPPSLKQINHPAETPGLLNAESGIFGDLDPEMFSFDDSISKYSWSDSNPDSDGVFMPASLGYSVSGIEPPSFAGLGDFSNLDIGQLNQIWDWQDLDLTLWPSVPVSSEMP